MEMRMSEDVEIGTELSPPLPPLAFSLRDSHLSSHCSACFSPLLSNTNPNPSFLCYCSPLCSASDSPLHFSTAEHHLFLFLLRHSHPHFSTDSSDLRAALRLLHVLRLPPLRTQPPNRVCGLLTNCHHFFSESDDTVTRIRDGGEAMAIARCMRDGTEFSGDSSLEEALLCLVLTNAVEVQVNGGSALGIAVYDWRFSWINHSCSPNACYRFLLSSPETPTPLFSVESRLQIVPGGDDEIEIENAIGRRSACSEGCNLYGPRIIVRSIKAIKKGEEVWVAYTDLLQPKAIRHAELWEKYRFSCCCSRCNALPPTYVDLVLQEILAESYMDEDIRKLTDYVDDAIADYLSVGNAEACCEMLENVLAQGLPDEQLEPVVGKSRANIRMHPLHHLSLAAYTTLASAYQVRASQLLDLHSDTEGNELEALSLSKASAAYSLLLAGATHHLFLSDSSLIASTANFWMNAGEALISLARNSLWNSFVEGRLHVLNLLSLQSHKCYNCSLADKFEVNSFGSGAHNGELKHVSKQFINCISSVTPKVWSSLFQAHHLCKIFKDPSDSNWPGKMETSTIWDFLAYSACTSMDSSSQDEESINASEAQRATNRERINLFKLGIHCLLYGGYLSSICYGPNSYLTYYIQNLVREGNLTDNSSHQNG